MLKSRHVCAFIRYVCSIELQCTPLSGWIKMWLWLAVHSIDTGCVSRSCFTPLCTIHGVTNACVCIGHVWSENRNLYQDNISPTKYIYTNVWSFTHVFPWDVRYKQHIAHIIVSLVVVAMLCAGCLQAAMSEINCLPSCSIVKWDCMCCIRINLLN